MLGLFGAFSLKCTQLKQAVASGDDELVRMLDKELEPIIANILSYRAKTSETAHMQLQFLNGLIRDEADDRSSVTRRSAAMSMLIDRYFRSTTEEQEQSQQALSRRLEKPSAVEMVDQPLLNEAILDGLPDRIAVVTTDHRYIYSNKANSQYLNISSLSMVGCHVSEFIGEESFKSAAMPAFERCFKGESIDYIHEGCRNSKNFATRCRMTPLRSVNNKIIGAILVLQCVSEVVELERS